MTEHTRYTDEQLAHALVASYLEHGIPNDHPLVNGIVRLLENQRTQRVAVIADIIAAAESVKLTSLAVVDQYQAQYLNAVKERDDTVTRMEWYRKALQHISSAKHSGANARWLIEIADAALSQPGQNEVN